MRQGGGLRNNYEEGKNSLHLRWGDSGREIIKEAVKRTKPKSSAKRAALKLKTKQMTNAKAARKTKTKKTKRAKMARETRKVAVPTAPIELKTVAKKAATAAIVAAGLAALDTALDALKPNNDSPAATDPNKSGSN